MQGGPHGRAALPECPRALCTVLQPQAAWQLTSGGGPRGGQAASARLCLGAHGLCFSRIF